MNRPVGITGVELSPTDKSHCYWCDTRITKQQARVMWSGHHAAGSFNRNNGETAGENEGGYMTEFAHAGCAFRFAPTVSVRDKRAKCTMCHEACEPGKRAMSRMGMPHARCTPSNTAPLHICFICLRVFVQKHTRVLRGFLSPQQMAAEVAWGVLAPRASPFVAAATATGVAGGKPVLPIDKGTFPYF
jgi:hypothetical protein